MPSPSASSPTSITGKLSRAPRLLFVLAGQSNMAGRDRSSPPTAGAQQDVVSLDAATATTAAISGTRHSLVAFAQREDAWGAAAHPLHADKPEKVGVGPGLSFAQHVLNGCGAACVGGVGLVPCAFGGSELARWEEGDLFAECVRRVELRLASPPPDGAVEEAATSSPSGRRVELCLASPPPDDDDRPVELAGLLWHQGENDCGDGASASTYGARLPAALDALRRAIGAPDLPVIVCELGYWLDQADPCYTHAVAINAAIVAAPGAMEHAACVSAHGLAHKGDRLHFDAPAAEALGIRYADAWLQMREPHGDDRTETEATTAATSRSSSSSRSSTHHPVKRAKATRQEEALAVGAHGGGGRGARPFSFPTTAQGAAEESRSRATTEAAVRDRP